jgi:hypothetical protein
MEEYLLDEDIFENNKEYFFYIFPAHFSPLGDLWKEELVKKLGKNFEPIYVSSSSNIFLSKQSNVIILNNQKNNRASSINTFTELSNIELNKLFSKTSTISRIIQKLSKKQKRIFIISYTNSFFKIKHKSIIFIGPNPEVATYFDSKIQAYKTFKKVNMKSPEFRIYKNINSLDKKIINYPVFISASYSSGSNQGMILREERDYDIFEKSLSQFNGKKPIVLVNYINKQKAVESSAYISGKNRVEVLNVVDEISKGTICVGNIYPSSASNIQKELIINATIKIGNYMSMYGYRGAFGCGFIIDTEGIVYISDLNPRKQGFFLGDLLFANKSPIHLDMKTFIDSEIELEPLIKKAKKQTWICYQVSSSNPFILRNKSPQDRIFNYKHFFNNKKMLNSYIFWPSNRAIYSNRMAYLFGFGKNVSKLKRDIQSLESRLKREYLSEKDRMYFFVKKILIKNAPVKATLYSIYHSITYIRRKYSDVERSCQPAFHIYRELIMSLYMKPYETKIVKQITKELSYIQEYKKNNVLFIGGGSIPYSALLIKKIYKTKVSTLDSSWLSFYFGKRLLLREGIRGIPYIYGNGQNFNNYAEYDLIYMASQTTFKLQMLDNILKQNKRNQTIVLRISRYYDKRFALDNRELSNVLLKYQAKSKFIRCEMHDLLIINK